MQEKYGCNVGLKSPAHITIATRDISKAAFAEAWNHFQHKMFEESFDADGLSLLKHNGAKWEIIYSAIFEA